MTPPLSADEVFAAALALADLRARSAYLDRACAGNPSLRQEVESLLAAAERAGTFLEATATDAGEVLREAQQSAGVPLGASALHADAGGGEIEVATLLLERGANLEAGDREGKTALIRAAGNP